jgi:hypothetical protein
MNEILTREQVEDAIAAIAAIKGIVGKQYSKRVSQ